MEDGSDRVITDHEAVEIAFPGSYVSRAALTADIASAFDATLTSAEDESAMQGFIEANPTMLVQHLVVGNGAWVIPRKRLGSEYVTDFLIVERDSFGFNWYAVELEHPKARIFTKKGDPSFVITHALRQSADWRIWLAHNRDYASRPRNHAGLGLLDIDPQLSGLILIGRDSETDAQTSALRRSLTHDHRVSIQSYDWLLRLAQERLTAMNQRETSFASANPIVGFLNEIFLRPLPDEATRTAVHEVFGNTWTSWVDASLIRGQVEWEGIELWSDADSGNEVIAPLMIIHDQDSSGSKKVGLNDWREWVHHVTEDINADYSLLITEIVPDEQLQERLTPDRDGVWSANEWYRYPEDAPPRLSRLDVLIHIPLATTLAEKQRRLAIARRVFERSRDIDQENKIEAARCHRERNKAAELKAEALALVPGDRVFHEHYGTGVVVSTSGFGADAEGIIAFESDVGEKCLLFGYAPISRLSK